VRSIFFFEGIPEMTQQSYEYVDGGRVPIKAWVRALPIGSNGHKIENSALVQARNVADLPFVFKHLPLMPDVHGGYGSTIGTVIATKGAIIPGAVGVDIGCGMMAIRLSLRAEDLPDSLGHVRAAIERAVPSGRTNDGQEGDRGAWHDIQTDNAARLKVLEPRAKAIFDKHPRCHNKFWANQLGSLGTGNHFIELCLDEEGRVWVMLHSGSRGLGNTIAKYFIALAKKEMERWFISLPDKDLSYLVEGSLYFNDYIEAMEFAQDYATENRKSMMDATLRALSRVLPPFTTEDVAVNCHHNYTTREHHFGENVWLTRKGAVQARLGTLGIIPGSMGAKSFIVRGKGCDESFHSCSHGAGRKMSRGHATSVFTLEDHALATAGVECRKDEGVLDETPGAYKDIMQVMESQRDLVDIVHTLKQVVCVKG